MGFNNNPFLGKGTVSIREPGGVWKDLGHATLNWPYYHGDFHQCLNRTKRITNPYRKAMLAEMRRLQLKGGGNIWNASPSVYRKWLKLNRYQKRCM